jgi:PAS domain-containing protein
MIQLVKKRYGRGGGMARVNKASTTLVKSGAKLKQVEEALRESRERFRKMFESVTDGISDHPHHLPADAGGLNKPV